MVALGTGSPTPAPADDPTGGASGGTWQSWRRFLGRVVYRSKREERREPPSFEARRLGLVMAYLRDPAGVLAQQERRRPAVLKALGLGALAVGAAASMAVPLLLGAPVWSGAVNAGWLLMWAGARGLIMRLAARAETTRAVLPAAAVPALAPFAFAAVPALDLLAAVISWRLTYAGLRGLGIAREEAHRTTAWAFGGQIAATGLAWLARGAVFVAFLSL